MYCTVICRSIISCEAQLEIMAQPKLKTSLRSDRYEFGHHWVIESALSQGHTINPSLVYS